MNSSQLFGFSTLAYLLASAVYIALFVFKNRKIGGAGTVLTIAGVLAQTAAMGLRWQESYDLGIGHAPLTNMYESLVFFSWCTALFYLFMEFKFKNRVIGAFVMPFAFVAMAYASFAKGMNQEISPLIPALQSNWLIAHVVTCFIGYGAFAMAGGLGLLERTVLAMRRQLPVAPLPENSPLTLWTFLEALKLPRNPSRANSRQQPLLPQPWYRQGAQNGGQLPVFTQADSLGIATSMLAGTMGTAGVTLAGLWSYVLDEDMFNTQVRATGNKATVLTSATFTHIAHLAECFAGIGLLLVVDKQGGRAHYVPLLLRTFPDWQIKILAETPEESSYYLHHESQRILLTFREKSELTSFPTALASMTSKYIRELLMEAFNQWWCQRVPGLKPTAGYYQDGRRWLKDVQPHLANLGIAQEQLMRIK